MCGSWNFLVRVSPQILTKDPLSVRVHGCYFPSARTDK